MTNLKDFGRLFAERLYGGEARVVRLETVKTTREFGCSLSVTIRYSCDSTTLVRTTFSHPGARQTCSRRGYTEFLHCRVYFSNMNFRIDVKVLPSPPKATIL